MTVGVCEEKRKVSVALEGGCFVTSPPVSVLSVGPLTFSGG